IASAVPHEPAPSTAILAIPLMRLARLAVCRLLAALAGGCRGARGRLGGRRAARVQRGRIARLLTLLQRLSVERVEIDRLEQQRREAALHDDVRDRFARIRVQRARAIAAEQQRALLLVVALKREYAGLRDLDEEQRRILILCLDGQCQRDFLRVRRDLARVRAHVELRLRRHLRVENLRGLRRLERQILDVNLLQYQLLYGLLCHGCLIPCDEKTWMGWAFTRRRAADRARRGHRAPSDRRIRRRARRR